MSTFNLLFPYIGPQNRKYTLSVLEAYIYILLNQNQGTNTPFTSTVNKNKNVQRGYQTWEMC